MLYIISAAADWIRGTGAMTASDVRTLRSQTPDRDISHTPAQTGLQTSDLSLSAVGKQIWQLPLKLRLMDEKK